MTIIFVSVLGYRWTEQRLRKTMGKHWKRNFDGLMNFNGPSLRVRGAVWCISRFISTVQEAMDLGKRAAARYAVDTYVKVKSRLKSGVLSCSVAHSTFVVMKR